MLNTVRSYWGMVTAPDNLASQVGVAMLSEGGNATEAMIQWRPSSREVALIYLL